MPNARLAEFLLRRATTPGRASAIAGDLLEQYPHRPFRFAVAVARILLALRWRQILGFAAAAVCFLLPVFAFAKFALGYLMKATERHQRFAMTPNASPLLFASMCLLAVAAFALAGPATRRMGFVSVALALTDFLSACYIFIHPASNRHIMALAFGVTLLLIAIPATRRPSLISLASATALAITLFIVVIPGSSLTNLHDKRIVALFIVRFLLAWLSAIAAGTAALSALQRRFVPTTPPVIN
jgi:hypothetical protein